jgi:hypothetical protein
VSDLPVLRRLHRLWLAFVVVVVGILGALPFLDPEPAEHPGGPARDARRGRWRGCVHRDRCDRPHLRSVPTGRRHAGASGVRSRSTLGFAIAQAPAVLGFALAFAFGMVLPAAIGGGCTAVCLVRARPSPARLRKLEAAWSDAGEDVSVSRAADRSSTPTHPRDPLPPDGDEVADPRDDDTDGIDPR